MAFFAVGVLTPVLPPIAESTIASRVVGTWTSATPRSQTEAAKPARSPTVPPPTATTVPSRPTRFASSPASSDSSPLIVLAPSPPAIASVGRVSSGSRGTARSAIATAVPDRKPPNPPSAPAPIRTG